VQAPEGPTDRPCDTMRSMGDPFFLRQSLPAIGLEIFVVFVAFNAVGYALGFRHSGLAGREQREHIAGTVTGAMLALVGFLLAIALSMADSHFEVRRRQILDEANAIGTSLLRAQTCGGPHGAEIQRLFKEYARLRLEFFAAGEDLGRIAQVDKQTAKLQQEIWDHGSAIAAAAPNPISALLLSALNETFDIATARRWALEVRVPPYVLYLLLVLSFAAMGLLGYYTGICGIRYPLLSAFLFLAFTVAILLVLDLNRPRAGLIQAEQQPLLWLVESLGQ